MHEAASEGIPRGPSAPAADILVSPLGFETAVERAMQSGIVGTRSFAVLMFALHPSWITENWLGSRSMNAYTEAIGDRLTPLLFDRDVATILAGGEWAVLLTNVTGPAEAATVAERISEIVSAPVDVRGDSGYPLVSAGIAAATGIHRRASDLIADARSAMSRAFERGPRQVAVFDEGLRLDLLHRSRTIKAVSHSDIGSHLELYFQPIVKVTDGSPIAVEALLRWRGGQSLGSPAHIVALAEQANLIDRLGEWVLESACLHAAQWAPSGVVTHVNFSPRQLLRPAVVDHVAMAIEASGLQPGDIAIEVTESATMTPEAVGHLLLLKDFGVKISLDDFGTGYANLSSLRDLPIDMVKLDRSVVAGIASNAPTRAMVGAVVTMARAIGVSVTAEGIETPEELQQIRDCGCDFAQGYLIGPPAPAESAARLLRSAAEVEA